MFTITINGNTLDELFGNIAAMLNTHKPVAPAQVYQPAPGSVGAVGSMGQTVQQTAPPAGVMPMAALQAPMTSQVSSQPPITTNPTYAAPVPSAAIPPVPSTPPATAMPPMMTSPSNPMPGVPMAAAPTYTLEQLAHAGAALAQSGKMNEALAVLARYGVQSVNQLKPDQYGAFATELRALGAQV